jgi:hypothetical protein
MPSLSCWNRPYHRPSLSHCSRQALDLCQCIHRGAQPYGKPAGPRQDRPDLFYAGRGPIVGMRPRNGREVAAGGLLDGLGPIQPSESEGLVECGRGGSRNLTPDAPVGSVRRTAVRLSCELAGRHHAEQRQRRPSAVAATQQAACPRPDPYRATRAACAAAGAWLGPRCW